MNQSDDHVNTCATFGHIYASVIVVRCPHTESYRVYHQVWQDDDYGDPIMIDQDSEEFGPFDAVGEVANRIADLTAGAVALASLVEPHPRAFRTL